MDKQIGSLSERDLSKIFQLVSEIQKKSFHEFSLIAIKNKDNNARVICTDYTKMTT